MRNFKELGVDNQVNGFVGEKISIQKIINVPIIVIDYNIAKSKFDKNVSGNCLNLQIEIDGNKMVTFSGSEVLMNTLLKIDKSLFPFLTTIVKNGNYYNFN